MRPRSASARQGEATRFRRVGRLRLAPGRLKRAATALLVTLALSLCTAAGVQAAGSRPTADATPADIARLLVGSPAASPETPAEDLALPESEPLEFLDELGVVLPCGTPIARAALGALPLATGPRAEALRRLVAAPRLAAGRFIPASEEPFVVEIDGSGLSRNQVSRRDLDHDRVPDTVQALHAELLIASRAVSDSLGWTGPSGTALRVVLAATPFAEGCSVDGTRPFIVVPADLEEGPERLQAVAHQLTHVALRDLAPDVPPEWEEALATFVAASVVAASHADAAAVGRTESDAAWPALPAPSRALLAPGLLAARSEAAFLTFLGTRPDAPGQALPSAWPAEVLTTFVKRLDALRTADRSGRLAPATVVAPRLLEAAELRLALAQSLDDVLATRGQSLPEALEAFHLYRLETDLLTRPAAVASDADLRLLPADEIRSGAELFPFSAVRIAVDVPVSGGLGLSFDGDDRVSAVAVALLEDGSLLRLRLDGAGGRPVDLRLPASRLSRVVVCVMTSLLPLEPAALEVRAPLAGEADPGFRLLAALEPGHPFVLAGIDGVAMANQVTLDWATESEADVTGWLVERALRPSGPYSPLARIPLPAAGAPGAAGSYAFIDPFVRPGSRYHYRVLALTSSGLAEPSPVIAVRTLPAAPAPRP